MSTPSGRRCLWISIMLATAGVAGPLQAQSFDESRRPLLPEIREMREQYTLRALDAGRVLADQYSRALAGLETQAAEASDYETALAAQRRRREIAQYYANRDMASGKSIVLKPTEGKITGAVSMIRSEDTLAFLRTSAAAASWDVSKIVPGLYTVSVVCGVGYTDSDEDGGAAGAEVEFGEVTTLAGAETARLRFVPEYTGGWNDFKTFGLGDIKLTRSSARFAIKSTVSNGSGGLMRLKEIRLTPAFPELNPTDVNAVEETLEELRNIIAAHQQKLRRLEQPLLNAYLSRLSALSETLIAKNDETGAGQVVAESKRVHESFGRPGKFIQASAGGSSTQGLEVVHDAKYVESAENSGDRFLVDAGGERFSVRLMSVSCPSPDPQDQERKEIHERYFGITKSDCVLIGRQARDITAACLKNRPLKLLTRWQKDGTGSVLAEVRVAEIGDLGGILVDNGLAMILEPTAKNPSQRKADAVIRDVLKQRESGARSKAVPPGAWAFADEIKPAT